MSKKELTCPNCGAKISLDEAEYAAIAEQVRTEEYERDVERRVNEMSENIRLTEQNKAALDLDKMKSVVEELKLQLSKADSEKVIAVTNAETEKQRKIDELQHKIETAEMNTQLAVAEKEKQDTVKINELEKQMSEIESRYKLELRDKDNEIEQLKTKRRQLSVKMIGENLEEHCKKTFEMHRAEFPNAVFKKDNEIVEGTKGDFVFRESDAHGNEFVSILFDMKDEAEDSTQKQKNEHFFKKLDKDRRNKNCQYAVLVSELEADDELYNQGITDVSLMSGYDKMFVVRPQFFMTFIRIVRGEAVKTLKLMQQLDEIKQSNISLENFEDKLKGVANNIVTYATNENNKIQDTRNFIDKAISALEKAKATLDQADKNLKKLESVTDQMTVKKLTAGNPIVREMIEAQNYEI